jgi:Fe2+ transport system protein B
MFNYARTWATLMALATAVAVVTANAGQGPEIKHVMRQKLVHSQKILEAVVTSDWIGLETHTRQLEALTNDPRWAALKFQDYARHSAAFARAVQNLHRAAAQRDLDETPKAYFTVTQQCVDCHRYMARTRIAR